MRTNTLARIIGTLTIFALTTTNIAFATINQSPKPTLGNDQVYQTPEPPNFDAKGYIAIDANSGYVLAEKNADTRLAPASLTKIMTLYVAAQYLKTGHLHFDDPVTVSEKAWRMDGSRMFIKVGSSVSVQQLLDGIVIASGNDASVALAEHIAGTEEAFVNLMNQTAVKLGMTNTNFADSNGLPAENHYSSARDLAILAKAWIHDFPEYYPWFKQQWMSYGGIKQPNRNRLLWRDSSVDGMKTGHTAEAGYCLVASALRNGARLITVVLDTPSPSARTNDTEALLNYGFRFFKSHKLYAAATPLSKQRVWFGKQKTVSVGLADDFYITTPVGQHPTLKSKATFKHLTAPIRKGQICGELIITADNKPIAAKPLVALTDDARGGFFSIFDHIWLLFHRA